MRVSMIVASLLLMAVIGETKQRPQPPTPGPTATRLSAISWPSAEASLKSDSVVVLPLGAASVQHGPHLPLDTDQRIVEHLAQRALQDLDVIIAPTLSYHYYESFREYPGSTSLSLNTARDVVADLTRSLSRYGPRRFYVLNGSSVTISALAEAAKAVARDGLLLRYTDPTARLAPTVRGIQRQPLGGHADEIETSMMLHIDAPAVDMSKATRDLGNESIPLMLTRRQTGRGTHSPSGVWGDATLATAAKGSTLVEALARAIRTDVEDLRTAPLPMASASTASAPVSPRPAVPAQAGSGRPNECPGGDERVIRSLGPAFAFAWANKDAIRLAYLWNPHGDVVHPDGLVEGSAQTILENRAALFARPEYKGSRHGLLIGLIRCIAPDVAVADAKWELRGVTNARGATLPVIEGLSTLVLKRREGEGWGIEAYRYTMKDTQNTSQPTLLNRPGFIDPIR